MDKQRAQEVEHKVRSMCYDMVLDVLDQERQLRAQNQTLTRAKSTFQRVGSPLMRDQVMQSQGVQGMNMASSMSM